MTIAAVNAGKSTGLETDPAAYAAAITPADATLLPHSTRGIFVGVGGDVVLYMLGGTAAITFKNVPSGYLLPVQAQAVDATGTLATNLIALW